MMKVSRLFLPLIIGTLMALVFLFGAEWQVTDTARAAMPVQADLQVAIRYVAPTGSDSTDCTNSANPCATIQYVVDQAGSGDEIRVASGHYTDVQPRTEHDPFLPNETLTQTVFITQPLTLRGGYTLTNWTVSDPFANPTTINPQGQGRGIVVMTTQGVTLEGFRILGGDATVDGYLFAQGGGIGVFYAGAVISACDVEGNVGYGGIGVDSSTAILHGNVITGHLSSGVYGGYSTITMTQNTVVENAGSFGGGIRIEHSEVALVENHVSINTASEWGGGIWLAFNMETLILSNTISNNTSADNGGGLVVGVTTGQDVIVGNTFTGNVSTGGFGGGAYMGGEEVTFRNNLLQENYAAFRGGGMHITGKAWVASNEFRRNESGGDGGGITAVGDSSGQFSLIGNSIISNTAALQGGGVFAEGTLSLINNIIVDNTVSPSEPWHSGSGVFVDGTVTLSHNTIADNQGGNGAGVVLQWNDTANLVDNIIISHTVGISVSANSTANLEATLWGNDTNWTGDGTITTGTIHLYGNPGFIDPANGDYHLSSDSIAIDAGIAAGVTTDIDGDARPLGAGFDIGADEFSAVIRYVATTGTNNSDCTDSANPCATIQYAVDQAGIGDEVRVAGGEYTGVNNHGGLSQMVYITKTMTVRGGYTITNWINSAPYLYPTTLDALGQGRVMYITGMINPTIEGLRITGGNADGLGGGQFIPGDYGGGLYVVSATVTMQHNELIDNVADAGGGASFRNGALISSMNVYSQNVALSFEGGAGGHLHDSVAIFIGDAFLSNLLGGGLVATNSTITVQDSLFDGNIAGNIASSVFRNGGAFLVLDSTAQLQNNTFTHNMAYGGGAIYLGMSPATLENNVIAMNVAGYGGGGILSEHSETTLLGNTIISNTAVQGGGGYFLGAVNSLPQVLLNGNLIAHNSASDGGGGLRLDDEVILTSINDQIVDNEGSYGSGIFIGTDSTEVRFIHSTIAHNSDGEGSGILSISGQVWLTNTILVSHTIGILVSGPTTVHLEATLWGNDTNWTGDGTITTGTINLYGDPSFIDPANGDYHLNPDSIAIDAGIDTGVTTDIDGDTRPFGAGFDIGADEFVISLMGSVTLPGRTDHSGAVVAAWVGETVVATTTTDSGGAYALSVPEGVYTITIEMPLYLDAVKTNIVILNTSPTILASVTLLGGDANESDKINIFDLSLIGSHYGLTCADPGWDPRADVNGDCVVNLLDLTLAAASFGKTSPVVWE